MDGETTQTNSAEATGATFLIIVVGLLIGGTLFLILLVAVVVSPGWLIAATAAGGDGGAGGCPPPAAASCINPDGNAVVAVALEMAAHLHGNPDVWYDAGFPRAVIAYWQQTCPGCSQWRNGNLQCVMLALAAYGVAGIRPPAAGNAIAFWSLYAHRAGWVEIPAAWAPAGQRGLPRAGDWIVWYSAFEPTVGHIAVVVQVRPPSGGQSGSVTFVEANGPGPVVTEPLLPDLTVRTWRGYAVVGYIRHV